MNSETISLRVGYKEERVTFHLGVISLEEESRYTQRFIDIIEANDARYEKEYVILVDALANWSTSMPTKSDALGVEKPLGEGTPSEAVREYFKVRTNEKERICNAAVLNFRDRMMPSVDFL